MKDTFNSDRILHMEVRSVLHGEKVADVEWQIKRNVANRSTIMADIDLDPAAV